MFCSFDKSQVTFEPLFLMVAGIELLRPLGLGPFAVGLKVFLRFDLRVKDSGSRV